MALQNSQLVYMVQQLVSQENLLFKQILTLLISATESSLQTQKKPGNAVRVISWIHYIFC